MSGMNDGVGDILATKAGDLQRVSALFILKAREVRMMTRIPSMNSCQILLVSMHSDMPYDCSDFTLC